MEQMNTGNTGQSRVSLDVHIPRGGRETPQAQEETSPHVQQHAEETMNSRQEKRDTEEGAREEDVQLAKSTERTEKQEKEDDLSKPIISDGNQSSGTVRNEITDAEMPASDNVAAHQEHVINNPDEKQTLKEQQTHGKGVELTNGLKLGYGQHGLEVALVKSVELLGGDEHELNGNCVQNDENERVYVQKPHLVHRADSVTPYNSMVNENETQQEETDIQQGFSRVSSATTPRAIGSRETERIRSGLREKTCTPSSMYGYYYDEAETMSGRTSHSENKERVFQQAVNLMSLRCASRPGSRAASNKSVPSQAASSVAVAVREEGSRTPLVGRRELPYGPYHPEFIYILQKKPAPMPPLKAWKGYYGNVYFQPLSIQKTSPSGPNPYERPPTNDSALYSDKLQSIMSRGKRSATSRLSANMSDVQSVSSRVTGNSFSSFRSRASNRSKATSVGSADKAHLILDKRQVLNDSNPHAREEAEAIWRRENTGSLCLLLERNLRGMNPPQWKKEKIRKGLVCRSPRGKRSQGGREAPIPAVASEPHLQLEGDRISDHDELQLSPIFRSGTQYTRSQQRRLTNTPEGSHRDLHALPPSLASRSGSDIGGVGVKANGPTLSNIAKENPAVMEANRIKALAEIRMQPLVKYSPEFKQYVNKTFRPAVSVSHST